MLKTKVKSDEVTLEQLQAEQLRRYARDRLVTFSGINMGHYKPNWHHHEIADRLQKVASGEIKRLMIFMPPRHGKSQLASIFFPAWFLGNEPAKSIIACSYNAELASDFGRKVRNIARSDIFSNVFPEAELSEDSTAAARWNTKKGGAYVASGVGGAITGRGCDVLLIDDPVKNREEALSDTTKSAVWDWYTSTAYTRLTPGGAVVLIMTRWTTDDLAGKLLEEMDNGGDQWDVLKLPAVATEDEEFRKEGDALWEGQYTVEQLEGIKKAVSPSDWSSLYQQEPVIEGGAIFKLDWWQYYKGGSHKGIQFDRVIQSWDTAFKRTSRSDWSCCMTVGVTKEAVYVLDLWRGRVEFPELRKKAMELHKRWNPHGILIEDKASGQSLIQELKRNTLMPIIPMKVDGDKIARAHAAAPMVESGKVFLPENTHWLPEFLHEASAFPAGKHDDQVDTLSQVFQYLHFIPNADTIEVTKSVLAGGPCDPLKRMAEVAERQEAEDDPMGSIFCEEDMECFW